MKSENREGKSMSGRHTRPLFAPASAVLGGAYIFHRNTADDNETAS